MAQTRDAMGLIGAGSLGYQLTPTVHPTHHYVAMGAGLTAGVLMSPVVVPAVQASIGLSTGLVPGLGEVLGLAAARNWISLHPVVAAGVAGGGVVGAANLYYNRSKIPGIIQKVDDFFFRLPTIEITFPPGGWNTESGGDQGGSLPSTPGVAKPGSIGSPLTQATRAPSRGRRGSRTSGRRRRAPEKCGAWHPRRPYQCVKPRGHRGRHYYR